MARVQSPGYPNFALPKGVELARKIFSADRRNPIDREVAAKHLGYTGLSGASDKVLGSLGHYNLLEKAGKGQVRVTQVAVDILHPVSTFGKKRALQDAAFSPSIFAEIRDHFSDGLPSETALKSWLMRENFLDRAILPVTKAYLGTCQYLEQEQAIESGGPSSDEGDKSGAPDDDEADDNAEKFGGAKVGDLIQWEVGGALQMEKPMRVRAVSDDGQWVAVEGSETGIPMSEVMVQERAPAPAAAPPIFKIPDPAANQQPKRSADESEWMRNKVGKATTVTLLVSGGEMGAKEIGHLIKLLEAQKAVLADDDADDLM
jgi:hypothetical protein